MLKRFALFMTVLMLLPLLTMAETYAPIYVDGEGHVTDKPPVSHTLNPGVMAPVTDTPVPEEDPEAVPKWYYESTQLTARWGNEIVKVTSVGTAVSQIVAAAGKLEVSTRDLVFAEDIPAGHQLATVVSSSAGNIRLYKKASTKATVLYRVTVGSILPVLNVGKSFSKVQYKDCIGYVRNSSLSFCDASDTAPEMTYIAYNGNTRSRNTIKVRQKASSASRILDELNCGLHATVLSTDGDWTEIEVNSLHCWIQSKFLTTPSADTEPLLACYITPSYSFGQTGSEALLTAAAIPTMEEATLPVSDLQASVATPLPTAIVTH